MRAYANLNDLAKSLRLSNVIDRDEDMRTFAEQFTNSRAEVDFVNVGRGKENADSKLRKMLNHYLRNLQCKKIFVACCHDNGYLQYVSEYPSSPNTLTVHEKRNITHTIAVQKRRSLTYSTAVISENIVTIPNSAIGLS